ncbi:MAG: PQQ-dependent sugar dehydrogenase, partial [Bacteroidota bacterium]
MKRLAIFCFCLLVFLNTWGHGNLPTGFVLEENYITGLENPTDLKFAPDGRLFIAEKSGRVRIVENGQLLEEPFYAVSTQVINERGLDGLILDPDFDLNGYVYLFYTHPIENKNVLARVTAAGNTAIPGSEVELYRFDNMWASWHNGGAMAFDTTGKLLVATGDGLGPNPQFL